MKKILNLCIVLFLLCSCGGDTIRLSNPYLPSTAVYLQINLNLPLFNKLNYAGNAVLIDGHGLNGVIVINTGTSFLAYEATCTNHRVESCSRLELVGVEAKCTCEHQLQYNLYIGQPTSAADYPLQPYMVYANGNVLTITN